MIAYACVLEGEVGGDRRREGQSIVVVTDLKFQHDFDSDKLS